MKQLSKETILKVIGLDLLIVFLFYYVSKFFIDKARDVLSLMQELNYQFGDINSVLETNQSNFNPLMLQDSVNLLNSYFSKLFFYIIASIIILFLIYVVIKSLMWNLICNDKLKNYKKYFLKFSGLAFVASLLILPLIYFVSLIFQLPFTRFFILILPFIYLGLARIIIKLTATEKSIMLIFGFA